MEKVVQVKGRLQQAVDQMRAAVAARRDSGFSGLIDTDPVKN